MLQSLHLKDFKSFADEKISFSPLTVLVGANASGKSNLVDAIRFLQGAALNMSLMDVLHGRWEGGRLTWPGLRGGAADVVRKGAQQFSLETVWRIGNEEITHDLGCESGDHPLLVHESLTSSAVAGYLFDTSAAALRDHAGRDSDSSIRVALKRTGKGNSPTQLHAATRSLLQQVKTDDPVSNDVARVRDALLSAMRAAYFLDITPSRMRDFVPRHITELGLEGENVSALAWSICQDANAKADLVDWLAELCAPELIDLDFARTDLGDVMLVLVEQGSRRIPARSLSDGTLRFLGELIALRTAPEGSLLLIEEIENGLHSTRAHLLVEAMEAATRTRNVQVIVTTHSPFVLNALSRESLRKAVLVARPPGSEGTLLRRLGDLPDFDDVCDRRGVDRMVTSGWLERAL